MPDNQDICPYAAIIPKNPSVVMAEALDNWIHDYYSGIASDKSNEGAKAQVAFILKAGGKADLDRIFSREFAAEQDYYFLVPEPCGWDHCFVGSHKTEIDFCMAIRRDNDAVTSIIAACTLIERRALSRSEKADVLESFEDNPEWIEDPEAWNLRRCDSIPAVPSVWWPSITEFFAQRGVEGMKSAQDAYSKMQAVMNAADCGDEDAADFLKYLDDRGYGIVKYTARPTNDPDPTVDWVLAALAEVGKDLSAGHFLDNLEKSGFTVGEV